MAKDILVEREKPCHCDGLTLVMHIHHFQEMMDAFRKGNPFMAFQILSSYESMVDLILEKAGYKKDGYERSKLRGAIH